MTEARHVPITDTDKKEAFMAHHDDNFKDESGLLSIVLGVVVLVSMSALPATIGWIQAFGG